MTCLIQGSAVRHNWSYFHFSCNNYGNCYNPSDWTKKKDDTTNVKKRNNRDAINSYWWKSKTQLTHAWWRITSFEFHSALSIQLYKTGALSPPTGYSVRHASRFCCLSVSLSENWSTGPWRSPMSQSFSWRSTSTRKWGPSAAAARRPHPMCVYASVCVSERGREQTSIRIVIHRCVWEFPEILSDF